MPETWPGDVPFEIQTRTFHLVPFRAPRRTDMEDGNRRRARSTTKKIATIQFSLEPMEPEQFRTFALWVEDTLVDGTLPFTMMVWTGTGDRYAQRVCTMAQDYSANDFVGDLTVVSLVLDVEDYVQDVASS